MEIKGTDLTDDLTVAVSGNGFTCPVTSIAKDEAANASFNVVFTPTAVGDYEGKLTISGGGLKENVEIACPEVHWWCRAKVRRKFLSLSAMCSF